MRFLDSLLSVALCLGPFAPALADSGVNAATRADLAVAKYGFTGKGVIIAVLDRGIDYTHPDFRNADGTTRIKHMWDMSNQNLCDPNNLAPVEYTEAAINQALQGGPPLAERDALGHGTATAGLAAGNGSAALPISKQWAGLAPEADLLIVRVTSEFVQAHNGQAQQPAFQGCYNQALDLVSQTAASLGEPIVAFIDAGTQFGPIDGTSAVSDRIDGDFGLNKPGYMYVSAAGDEGTLPNHARATYSATPQAFPFTLQPGSDGIITGWYTGGVPANVTVTTADDGGTATAPAGGFASVDGISIYQYAPGQQFYPWTSSGPDRAVYVDIIGHSGAGTISFQATPAGTGIADIYGDTGGIVTFPSLLTPGRLSDFSSTLSATVVGCYNVRTSWTDIKGRPQSLTNQGGVGQLWTFSSGGPTRDGRAPPLGGVDVATPGGNSFTAYGLNSWWETFKFNLIFQGKGYYGRHSATSAAAPILAGSAALLLQMDPTLTASQIRQILHQTAISDADTGTTPNFEWGAGKLDVLGAADAVAALIPASPTLNKTSPTFASQAVGTTSKPQTVVLRNSGTAALTITSIATSGDFRLKSETCGASLQAGQSCKITATFRPSQTGIRSGALVVTDFNIHSPQTVALSGVGQ